MCLLLPRNRIKLPEKVICAKGNVWQKLSLERNLLQLHVTLYINALQMPLNVHETRYMATRKLRCGRCGVKFQAPLEAQHVSCPACRYSTIFQGGYRPAGGGVNVNYRASNIIVRGQGYFAVNRPNQTMNTGTGYQLQTQIYPPPAHGRKRAVLCGITYKGQNQSLRGSINDVLWMKNLLTQRFGFPNSSVLVLTEEEDYNHIPTKQNIRAALRWLVHGCQSGDSLVFHYSGHGSQVRDLNGDEIDGYDESILPVDYQTEGKILDDEINATIVRPLPEGAILHAIVDTCFSGTILDLPNVCRINREGYYRWEDHRMPRAAFKGTNGGWAISIGACDDHQNSGDTTAFTGTPTGALTYSFVQILEHEPRSTYGSLLISLHNKIANARAGIGLNSNAPHLSQEPQLSSSHKFDIHSKPFTF